jgi:hypothetical protein
MEFFGADLPNDENHEQREEKRGSGKIALVQRHRTSIAPSLTERRCGDLNDPEYDCNFGNFTDASLNIARHFHSKFLTNLHRTGAADRSR